jgi:hypothetical protein
MKSHVQISIPEPCHENWQQMTQVEKGKFCDSCQKKVFDFTAASDHEIRLKIGADQNLCGRFLLSQLNRDLHLKKEKSPLWIAAATAAISFLGLHPQQALAQGNPTVAIVEGDPTSPKTAQVHKAGLKTVTGTISDNAGPLPGANIEVRDTLGNVYAKTNSDTDGKFSIVAKQGDTLLAMYVGFEDKTIQIGDENDYSITLIADLRLASMAGGITIKSRTFAGRIFHSIGTIFKPKANLGRH